MVVDSRMDEMTRLFRLPTLPMEDFRLEKPLGILLRLGRLYRFQQGVPGKNARFPRFSSAERAGGGGGRMIHAVGTALGEIIPKSAAKPARPDALTRNRSRRCGDAAGALVGLAQPAAANPHLLVRLFRRAGSAGKKTDSRINCGLMCGMMPWLGAQLRHSRRVRVHPAGRVHYPQRAHSALHHPDEGSCARVLRAFVDDGDSADCAAPWRRAGDVALSGTGVLPRGFVGAADRRGTADEQPDGGLSRLRRAASAADAPAVLRFQRRVGH